METLEKDKKTIGIKRKVNKTKNEITQQENTKGLGIESITLYNENPLKFHKNLKNAIKSGIINGTNFELLLRDLDNANDDNRILIYFQVFKEINTLKKQSPLVRKVTLKYIMNNLEKILDRLEVDKLDLTVNDPIFSHQRLITFFDSVIRKSFAKNDKELIIITKNKREADLRKISCLCYMYLMLLCYTDTFSIPNYKNMLIIEKAFAGYFSEIKPENQNQYVGKSIVETLDKKSFKKDLQKHIYLSISDEAIVIDLKRQKDELSSSITDLNDYIKELKIKIEQLKLDIDTLEHNNTIFKNENLELQNARIRAENRLEFEVNKYSNHFETYKESVIKELKKDLDHELLGIRNIIEYSDQDLVSRIERRLSRIEKLIEIKNK